MTKISVVLGQTISVARLLHSPEKRAVRTAARAQKLSASRAYDRAAAELELAIEYDPDYPDAYNNLGVQYMRLGRTSEAVTAFRRAIALDPGGALQQANLAVALARSGRPAEAETWARAAVRLDPTNPGTRNVLETIRNALRHVQETSPRPVARTSAAR